MDTKPSPIKWTCQGYKKQITVPWTRLAHKVWASCGGITVYTMLGIPFQYWEENSFEVIDMYGSQAEFFIPGEEYTIKRKKEQQNGTKN